MNNIKKKSKFSCHCAVLPTNENPLSDDLFDLDETSIVYPSEDFDAVHRWDFDSVLNGPKDFLESYKAHIAPLVHSVERGENSMLIFNGVPFMDPMEYLTTRKGRSGFISLAADQLIKSAVTGRQKLATVTFSWYKVECSSSEAITDLLRVASTPNTAKGPDPNLVLREVGKGKGMFVSGLWEVELAAGSDIESVIAHVSKLVPGSAHTGSSHSVFQLSLNPIKQGGGASNVTTSQTMLEDNAPSRLTFVLLSGLAPPISTVSNDRHPPQSPPAYHWVDQLSDLLVWMNARRPSPPFHKSRVLLLLRDAISGRMPCAMYFLMQPTVPAVPENCLWLQLCHRIRDIILQRANTLSGHQQSGNVGSISPAVPAATPTNPAGNSSSVKGAPLSGHMMYPATTSPLSHDGGNNYGFSYNEYHEEVKSGTFPNVEQTESVTNRAAVPNADEEERDDISFESLRRRASEISTGIRSERGDAHYDASSHYPGGPGGGNQAMTRAGRGGTVGDYYSSSHPRDFPHEDEPFQYLPSPPPPAPPTTAPDSIGPSTGYVNPFDEVLAARGMKPVYSSPQRQLQGQSRRHTTSDASEAVHHALYSSQTQNKDYTYYNGNTARSTIDLDFYETYPEKPSTTSDAGQERGGSSRDGARDNRSSAKLNNSAQHQTRPSDADELLSRREERNAPPEPKPSQTLHGLEPSDLEALLEALHCSREENKTVSDALAAAEDRCAKMTREYERLVAKVQEEGYFLRIKEREKFKQVLQDLKDYEVYKQVMETAMSKMQAELDVLVKENKSVREDNVAQDRLIRKLKTDNLKFQRLQSDSQREATATAGLIQELQDKLNVRSREKDSAVEALSQLKLKSSKHDAEMSAKIKLQAEEIKDLSTRLEDISAKFEASEAARVSLEEGSQKEVEKLRAAHVAALDKCMGYQEENDLLRASLSDIIEAQENAMLSEGN